MNRHRYYLVLLRSLALAFAMTLPDVLPPVTAISTPPSQQTQAAVSVDSLDAAASQDPFTVTAGDMPLGASDERSADVTFPPTSAAPVPPRGTAQPSLPASVSTDWWATAQENIRKSEYHVSWQGHTFLPHVPAAYQAPNRAHNLRTYFTPAGIRIIPRAFAQEDGKGGNWELGMALTGYGDADAVASATVSPKIVVNANRVEYHHPALTAGDPESEITEWYANDERGLEQGFTIAAPPASSPGLLVLELALSGNLSPSLTDDGSAILFAAADRVPVLRYGDLRASDATGRALPAHLSLSLSHLSIRVDTTQAIYPITIDPTITGYSTTPNWTAEGDQVGALFGRAAHTAGDVNGDGYDDVIIGAPGYDSGQAVGRVFVYYGSPTGLGTTANWMVDGDQANSGFGLWLGTAGNVNGDDYADIIVGAPAYDITGTVTLTDAGRVYVYYGSASGLITATVWITGGDQAGARFGESVATAGDVNHDDYDDVIIGASLYDITGTAPLTDAGRVYVFLGSAAGLSASPHRIINGDQADAVLGSSAGTAGDVNGDGFSDVIVGAPYYHNLEADEGRAYVYTGTASGLSATPAWVVESDQANGLMGASVGTAGDVNGDGYDDVVVGASAYDGGRSNEGRAYVYTGTATGLSTTPAWTVESGQAEGWLGCAVSTAGDVNGDGYADVIVSAHGYDNGEVDEGRAYVFYGSAAGLVITPSWTTESDQAYAYLSMSVGTAGDVNGDGYDDVVIGAPYYDITGTATLTDAGRVYLYYGSASGLGSIANCWVHLNDDPGEYSSVQAAVDASTHVTDVVKVAGYCAGVRFREGVTQTVYLNKTLTIRGGYTTTNWTTPYPITQPTTLDAQGRGRVLYIASGGSPTIEGLRIMGGNATGLDGPCSWGDCGGGIYINAPATISNCLILSSTAQYGGGALLFWSSAALYNNVITGNLGGDGLRLEWSPATVAGNTIASNNGAGVNLFYSSATLNANTISANSGSGLDVQNSCPMLTANTISANSSGGMFLMGGSAVMTANIVTANQATGIYLWDNDATLVANTIASNTTTWSGGGLILYGSDAALINNLIADNHAESQGSGLYISESSPRLLHNTIVRNTGGDGSGIYVTGSGSSHSAVALTNTILMSHTVGIGVTDGNTVTIHGVLWYSNTANTSGAGLVAVTHEITGSPAFAADGYHLTAGSAAIDAGVDAGVTTDIDGEPRPSVGSDLGADEFPVALRVSKHADPDPAQAGAQLTYTIRVTNTGSVTLTATITDVLPEHVMPTGTLTWTAEIIAPDGVWTRIVTVTVDWGYTGALTNVAQVTTVEGATGACTATATAFLSAPGVPMLMAPPNGSVTATHTITFAWQMGVGETPSGYNLWLDGTVVTTSNTFSPTVLATGVHTWTVRALNNAGYSDWANTWTIEVIQHRIYLPVVLHLP